MAYTLRDIIKQRTGEIAATQIQPTIFKFREGDEWIYSTKIKKIGSKTTTDINLYNAQQLDKSEIYELTELPEFTYVKQIGTSVEEVRSMQLDMSEYSDDTIMPKDLFKHAVNLISANLCFSNFNGNIAKITQIPERFLKNCRKLRDVSEMFSSCRNLKIIPEDLFASCPDILNFDRLFWDNYSLEEIPEGLFANNINARSFFGTFAFCVNLKNIPKNLFVNNKNVEDMSGTFNRCVNLEGEAPELWMYRYKEGYRKQVTGNKCFSGCTKLSNYNQIPSNWK